MKYTRAAESSQPDDAPTRDRVVKSILESGPSTAADLAERLELTPAAVRRHLDQLLSEGTIEAREPRVTGHRGRGRPPKIFVITDAGRDEFAQQYDDLAVHALRFLADTSGDEAVLEFARRRVGELEERYRPLIEAVPVEDRPRVLADALSADGYAASVRTAPSGDQVCQHHCPVAHVAAEFPQLCDAETEVFSRLLGQHVQRLATIAHGDGVCTTNVPDHDRNPTAAGAVSTAGAPAAATTGSNNPGRTPR
ncbi:transcriptional regulator [Nocardioidaceae bacterium SCSIO 66511]|nr:transcriptional regulator [Nocardioidaceae bacterium SCSIO 66511]